MIRNALTRICALHTAGDVLSRIHTFHVNFKHMHTHTHTGLIKLGELSPRHSDSFAHLQPPTNESYLPTTSARNPVSSVMKGLMIQRLRKNSLLGVPPGIDQNTSISGGSFARHSTGALSRSAGFAFAPQPGDLLTCTQIIQMRVCGFRQQSRVLV